MKKLTRETKRRLHSGPSSEICIRDMRGKEKPFRYNTEQSPQVSDPAHEYGTAIPMWWGGEKAASLEALEENHLYLNQTW